ncbi:ATP-binding cassette domain-containing protein [Salinibacterium sp. UTAS2018]|uniref:ATP-binding cassette domain-containing protein n=1 Tax=Salinibacterium sp. UTAS2018 TaxID=2508880 RepID=UPI00100979D9|nr:ATP-binding cassette domain-containing protein [Salinibacterium sp. UTAS2018]QAV71188.1 ATP-binding cassette domain-containing protein [Salinibacterium sp. UTAS2018]
MSLILEGVGHQYDEGRTLFTGIDVTLDVGRSYAVVGPSGSGKSTLLAIMSGDITPTQGRVIRTPPSKVSWVFQNPHGVAGRTALDHVSLPFMVRGWERADAQVHASRLLEEFGLASVQSTKFRYLSGGEAQRLMLVRAIASSPDLLLVDEPTAQLDRSTAETVNQSLQRLRGHGCIVVIATHDEGTRASCSDLLDLARAQA